MEPDDERNLDLRPPDMFEQVNNYFLLFFAFACLLGSVYIQTLFIYLGQLRLGIAVSSFFGIILPIYVFSRRFHSGFTQQLKIQPVRPELAVQVVLATMMVVVVVDVIFIITQRIFPTPPDFVEGLMELKPASLYEYVVTFAGLCLAVPIAEEIIFRGMFQRVFTRNMGGVFAFVLAGVFFGVVHMDAHLLISISVFGIFLGFLFYATDNLTYPIMAHALFNTVSFIQLASTPEDLLEEPPFYIQDTRILVAAIVMLVFFLVKIKKGGAGTEPPIDPMD
jgi:membrane protease YdiL (CAAX protease family)